MKKHLFPEGRKFYKANLHCHTVISDGKKTPEQIKAMYRAQGYDAVAFTDHEALILHDELTDASFVALNGYETAVKERNRVSTGDHPMMKVHHLCFIKFREKDFSVITKHTSKHTNLSTFLRANKISFYIAWCRNRL